MRARVGTLAALAISLASLIAAAGCGSSSPGASAPDGDRLSVVATTTQVADFVRNLGGDKVYVTQILKANVDPHDYEPSPADLTKIGKAKVVVKNGVGLEKSWLDQTLEGAGFAGTLVDASQGVAVHSGDDEPDGDPHIWQNPRNARTMAFNITRALSAADPGDAGSYQEQLTAYLSKLDRLDTDIESKISTIPADQRKLVTNHDAFGYYIERYKLEFVGSIIPSFDTSAELSGSQLTELVAKVKATGVKAIFSESSLPPKTAATIATQTGVRVEAGEDSLFADTLGPEGSKGATYIDAMTHNTDVIVRALRD